MPACAGFLLNFFEDFVGSPQGQVSTCDNFSEGTFREVVACRDLTPTQLCGESVVLQEALCF